MFSIFKDHNANKSFSGLSWVILSIYVFSMICVLYYIINCNFNLYTERNVFAKNFFLSFLATFFKIKKFIKKKKIHRYMFLEHVDNLGKFLKFFVKKKKKKKNTLDKKRGQNTLFLPLSQKCSSL